MVIDLLAPILNCQPQELAAEIDHAYRAHSAYTRKNKLPLDSQKFKKIEQTDKVFSRLNTHLGN